MTTDERRIKTTSRAKEEPFARFFTQLDAILGRRPASAPSHVVASVPGPSNLQESSGTCNPETNERDVDVIAYEEEEEEHHDSAANEGMFRNLNAMFQSYVLSAFYRQFPATGLFFHC